MQPKANDRQKLIRTVGTAPLAFKNEEKNARIRSGREADSATSVVVDLISLKTKVGYLGLILPVRARTRD